MNLSQIAERLKQNDVVAYPTEAVFGLGCNPLSQTAVEQLLRLKQRPMEKGLILVAPSLDFLLPFIDQTALSTDDLARLNTPPNHPTTWIVPAHADTPKFLTGQFSSIAVRLCSHPAVAKLCQAVGFALTSTSANLSGEPPCRSAEEVRSQFGKNFPVLNEPVGNAQNPSEIRNLLTNQLVRQG